MNTMQRTMIMPTSVLNTHLSPGRGLSAYLELEEAQDQARILASEALRKYRPLRPPPGRTATSLVQCDELRLTGRKLPDPLKLLALAIPYDLIAPLPFHQRHRKTSTECQEVWTLMTR